jgi:hypothetical protein
VAATPFHRGTPIPVRCSPPVRKAIGLAPTCSSRSPSHAKSSGLGPHLRPLLCLDATTCPLDWGAPIPQLLQVWWSDSAVSSHSNRRIVGKAEARMTEDFEANGFNDVRQPDGFGTFPWTASRTWKLEDSAPGAGSSPRATLDTSLSLADVDRRRSTSSTIGGSTFPSLGIRRG